MDRITYGEFIDIFPSISCRGLTGRIGRCSFPCLTNPTTTLNNKRINQSRFCPKCEQAAFFVEGGNDLECQCPGCSHKACRLCKEAPHRNLTCDEAKMEKAKTNAHAQMADAMTQAVMRSCPGCKTNIMKEYGCNKMTCPNINCKTKFCYSCREKVRCH